MKLIPYWKVEEHPGRPATASIGLGRAEVELSLPAAHEVSEPCLLVEATQEAEDCYHPTRMEYLLPIEMLKQLLLEHGYELTKKETP
jgi:hypothetical protein